MSSDLHLESTLEEAKKQDAGRVMAFPAHDVTCAVPMTAVHRILQEPKLTRMLQQPACARGFFDLDGTFVPVLDLCKRLGIEGPELQSPCVLIVNITPDEDRKHLLGLAFTGAPEIVEPKQEASNDPALLRQGGLSDQAIVQEILQTEDGGVLALLDFEKLLDF